jgi:hypothetical protein
MLIPKKYEYMFGDNLEQDCHFLFCYLEDMNLPTSNNRKELNPVITSSGNHARPQSSLFGLTTFSTYGGKIGEEYKREESEIYKGYYKSKLMLEYPKMIDVFKEFTDKYIPNFKYQQIIINKNFQCLPHKDKNNVGVSNIIALGDYTGGELMIQANGFIRKCDIQHKFKEFNGCIHQHWVEPFTPTRYSLVFYNIID